MKILRYTMLYYTILYYTILYTINGYKINKIHSKLHIYGITLQNYIRTTTHNMHFYEQQEIKQERHLEQNVFQVLGLLTSKHALKKQTNKH
jgi:hypothetical protein